MLISKNWLSEFVTLPKGVSTQDLAARLTLSTVEVERVVDQADALKSIVVGRVLSCVKHPNADRLKVCQVEIGSAGKGESEGSRVEQIVCGGTNVREQMLVAVALPGAWVRWHGQGDPVELKETKIRGEASFGMICASVELGLDNPNEGDHEILDLGDIDAEPGTPLARVLGRDDVVFEIEHKSLTNRPDLMGHYGIAREISALYNTKLKPYEPAAIRAGKGFALSVRVEAKDLCPRYMAVAMDGVVVGPSPEWLRNRLSACGVRSINTVVDVTNFVMLEYGQPMHAFDAARLPDGKIMVRKAKKGEKIACLDGQTYELGSENLVIANAKEAVAIAGVMGGAQSGVSDQTTSIVFESANFAPASVRRTSQRLALRSESSARFEKSLDPASCEAALRRAVALMRELCPSARVISKVVDERTRAAKPLTISVAADAPERLLGVAISAKEVKGILERLGCSVKATKASYVVTVPSWRATKDISIAEDVIEEIARIWGYDRIPSTLPRFQITPPVQDPQRRLAREARHTLRDQFAAVETYNYAFVSPETLGALHLPVNAHLELANPLSSERPYLVRSLVPNLLENVRKNQRVQDTVRLFETARVFLADSENDGLPSQPHMLASVFACKGDTEPFWEMKRIATGLLTALVYQVSVRPSASIQPWSHADRHAELVVGDVVIGMLAEIDPAIGASFGLDHRTAVMELDLDALAQQPHSDSRYQPLSVYPDVKRDLAFFIDENAEYGALDSAIRRASPLVIDAYLFDVYRGKGVPDGKKSLAVHITLRSQDRTLSSEEADGEVKKLTGVIEGQFGGIMRT